PPALLVSPEDALRAVRAAITLGAVVPEMRVQADTLATDIAALVSVRKEIGSQRDQLANELDLLGREQLRVTSLADVGHNNHARAAQALSGARQHVSALPNQVDTITDLSAKLEPGLDRTKRAVRDAARGVVKDATQPELAALSDPGRLVPAIAFADLRGRLRLPVNGTRIREFGGPDGAGGTQKGLSIAARPSGSITAPCDGWVVYAGRFRSYGQLLILNAGGG